MNSNQQNIKLAKFTKIQGNSRKFLSRFKQINILGIYKVNLFNSVNEMVKLTVIALACKTETTSALFFKVIKVDGRISWQGILFSFFLSSPLKLVQSYFQP